MRNAQCPICEVEVPAILQLHFNRKMNLPIQVTIRHCALDNFLFVAGGDQNDYDEYYKSVANDSYHAELAAGDLHSPISKLQRDHLLRLLGGEFGQSKNVLDFGCGEASLLVELAGEFPLSSFWGFDPGPGAQIGANKAKALGLTNLAVSNVKPIDRRYDLIILSHVLEHLLDFDLLHVLNTLLTENGLLYIEVPNSLQYANYERQEFLYYFDRLHVNHFTPQSLARLAAAHGFGHIGHVEYTFPYRDSKEYPSLGMLFRKGQDSIDVRCTSILQTTTLYISQEKKKANALRERLHEFEGVLVWGAGDNFYRSSENGGPLSSLPNMVVLDKQPQVVTVGGRRLITEAPAEGIRRYPWPVVIAVSEGRKSISQQVKEIDVSRPVFFL